MLVGRGAASGEQRATDAARAAVAVLAPTIGEADTVVVDVVGGSDLGLFEVNGAAEVVAAAAPRDADLIFSGSVDDALEDEVRVTVVLPR
jgi:cell division protein FtsZ